MSPRTEFGRLVWREYRQVRTFGLLLLGCGAALLLLGIANDSSPAPLTMFALVMAILFAVASAATAFSNEHENGTFLFQRVLPTSLGNVVAAKIGVAAGGALFIYLTLWMFILVDSAFSGWLWMSEASPGIEFAQGFLTLVEFLVFGMLLSLVERRPLVGLAKAVAIVLGIRWLGFTLDLLVYHGFSNAPDFPWPSQSLRLVLLAVGIALAYRFIGSWNADEPIRLLPDAIGRTFRRDLTVLYPVGSVRRGEWRRLLWLQYRVSAWPIAAFTIFGIFLALFGNQIDPSPIYRPPLATLLLGATTFWASKKYSLSFAAFGAYPQRVWLSQLAIPVAASFVVVLALMFPQPGFKLRPGYYEDVQTISIVIYTSLAALTWGQLASLRCRGILTAVGLSFCYSLLALLWIMLAVGAEARFWLFVLPVIVYPLVESFFCARRWLSDGKQFRLWWLVRFGLYASLALGLIVYRYYEIPGVSQHDLDRALSIVPRMNEAQTARFRVLADALSDREAFEPTDVHNQIEIELALRNNQYLWVADHRALVDEIIDGPYLTLQLQTDKSAHDADRMRFGTINLFVLAVLETALHEGDVDLGERIIRKIPINVSPTDTLRWCRLPMNDSQRIRRLAHQLQDASVFDRECRRVLLRQWLLPNLKETWREKYQWSIIHTSNWFETAALYIATDGIRWKRSARFFTVEAARQLEAILPGYPPEDVFAKPRELNRAKTPAAAPSKQRSQEEIPTIYAQSAYSGVLGKLGGMSLQLALVSWQMDHDGRLPNSLDELTIEYMPKLRFDPNGGADFIYEKDRLATGKEIALPGAKFYFEFMFGGGTRAIDVPFKVSAGNQRMRDSEGRLPPMVLSSSALTVQRFQLNTAYWNMAEGVGMVFPLDLPADETGSNNSVNQPTDEVAPVK